MSRDNYNDNNSIFDDEYSNEDIYDEQESVEEPIKPPKKQNPLDTVKSFFVNLWARIQSFGVKRAAIIAGLALVLILIIIIVAATSHSNKKPSDTKKPANNISVVDEEKSSEPVVKTPVVQNNLTSGGEYTVVLDTADSVNMRERASSDAELITTIPNGTVLTVLFVDDKDKDENNNYGWGYVEYENERGWVFMEYLKQGRQTVPNANGSVG